MDTNTIFLFLIANKPEAYHLLNFFNVYVMRTRETIYIIKKISLADVGSTVNF